MQLDFIDKYSYLCTKSKTMSINTAPKFGKIELLIKNEGYNDKDLRSTTRIQFLDCGLMITGDHLIILIDDKDDINKSPTTTGRIFNLKDVSAYKTYAL
jgi:hypothetical protein